ncbi:MAG: hypothetical protein ACK56I_01330, partial [bacterium]
MGRQPDAVVHVGELARQCLREVLAQLVALADHRPDVARGARVGGVHFDEGPQARGLALVDHGDAPDRAPHRGGACSPRTRTAVRWRSVCAARAKCSAAKTAAPAGQIVRTTQTTRPNQAIDSPAPSTT